MELPITRSPETRHNTWLHSQGNHTRRSGRTQTSLLTSRDAIRDCLATGAVFTLGKKRLSGVKFFHLSIKQTQKSSVQQKHTKRRHVQTKAGRNPPINLTIVELPVLSGLQRGFGQGSAQVCRGWGWFRWRVLVSVSRCLTGGSGSRHATRRSACSEMDVSAFILQRARNSSRCEQSCMQSSQSHRGGARGGGGTQQPSEPPTHTPTNTCLIFTKCAMVNIVARSKDLGRDKS